MVPPLAVSVADVPEHIVVAVGVMVKVTNGITVDVTFIILVQLPMAPTMV